MKLPSEDADWYVLTARSGSELIAADELRAGGYEAYVPQRRIKSFVRRHRLITEQHRPLMAGYVFVAAERHRTDELQGLRHKDAFRHVGRVLRGIYGPLRIPAAIIVKIHVDETNGVFDETGATKKANHQKLAERFRKGNMVRIEDGALIGFKALVEGITAHDRVKALVEIFGRLSTVEFLPEQLSSAA